MRSPRPSSSLTEGEGGSGVSGDLGARPRHSAPHPPRASGKAHFPARTSVPRSSLRPTRPRPRGVGSLGLWVPVAPLFQPESTGLRLPEPAGRCAAAATQIRPETERQQKARQQRRLQDAAPGPPANGIQAPRAARPRPSPTQNLPKFPRGPRTGTGGAASHLEG